MAVLGSTVDPRLGAVSPAAIQALSQAGAATGQMYANLGSSIAGVIQDFKSNRDDSVLQQAYLDSLQVDDEGNQKVDRKKFLQTAKDNKVSSKLAQAYLKNELEISSIQNQMDIQNKMAGYEDRKVQLAEDTFTFEKQFKDAEQRIRISQWANQNLMEMQKLNAMLEANKIDEDRYRKEYKLALRDYKNKLKELELEEDLTDAQIKVLNNEALLKKAEIDVVQAERDSYTDKDGLIGDEVALINSVTQSLAMDRAAFESLDLTARKALIDEKLGQVRGGDGFLEDPGLQSFKKLSDRYKNLILLRMTPEEFAAHQQQQQPYLPPTRGLQAPRRQRNTYSF